MLGPRTFQGVNARVTLQTLVVILGSIQNCSQSVPKASPAVGQKNSALFMHINAQCHVLIQSSKEKMTDDEWYNIFISVSTALDPTFGIITQGNGNPENLLVRLITKHIKLQCKCNILFLCLQLTATAWMCEIYVPTMTNTRLVVLVKKRISTVPTSQQ